MSTTIDLQNKIIELERIVTQLQDSLTQEQKRNAIKSQFIATGAHEFRAPLTTILNSADFLGMVGRSCNEQKFLEHITKIQQAVNFLADFSEDVLTISKFEIRNPSVKPANFSLEEFCRQLVDGLISTWPSNTIIYKFSGVTASIYHDKHLLQHIIVNLLDNAIKYSPSGKPIELNVSVTENLFELTVHDEGRGICEDDLQRLFRPFERGSNIGTTLGTGLGLFIVKKSVELLNGTIDVHSVPAIGTTVTIQAPLLEHAAH